MTKLNAQTTGQKLAEELDKALIETFAIRSDYTAALEAAIATLEECIDAANDEAEEEDDEEEDKEDA
jgi:hypothetical protein